MGRLSDWRSEMADGAILLSFLDSDVVSVRLNGLIVVLLLVH